MGIDNKPKYYGSMVRVSVTTKGGIEYTVHLEDVDAIPKEWIVDWLTRQHIPASHTCDDYYAVEMMLDDWEKENER